MIQTEGALDSHKYDNIVLDADKETALWHKNHNIVAVEEYPFSHFLHYNNDRNGESESNLFFPIRYYEWNRDNRRINNVD